MRRFFLLLLCCFILTTAVSAANTATQVQSNTIISSDGTCQVTLTVQLQVDSPPGNLSFPLPVQARNVSLNGRGVRTQLSGNCRLVDLSGAVPTLGTHTFMLHYSLPDAVVITDKGKLVLNLELLSGFSYPISQMSFEISLPGKPETRPEFVSTYHQQSVESLMDLQIQDNTIRGQFQQGLRDHESLSMSLSVSEELFPQPISKRWSLSSDDIIMYICAALGLLYWLFSMRALPPRRVRRTKEPEGLSAGELGCCLAGMGVDFTMMVISWAQMGYILIQLDDNGRVLLHKRMDMGNERSDFENRYFRILFGRRKTADGTGYHFARLSRKASEVTLGKKNYFIRGSGNPKILRGISALLGAIGGVSLALALASDTVWQVILGILLFVLGGFVSWKIHEGAARLHLRKGPVVLIALGSSLLWLFLGVLAGEWGVSAFVLAWQWLTGLAVAYGGRRNDSGKLLMSEILGLRRYLKSIPKDELQRILRSNPEFFYRFAPYAMALGVDKAFARQLGAMRLPECTYLTTGMDGHLTALEWNRLLRETAEALDERMLRLPYEKLLGK